MLELINKMIPVKSHEYYRCDYDIDTPEHIIFRLIRNSLSIFLSLSGDDTDSLGTSTKLLDLEKPKDHYPYKDSLDIHMFLCTVFELYGLTKSHDEIFKHGTSIDDTTIGDIVEVVARLQNQKE